MESISLIVSTLIGTKEDLHPHVVEASSGTRSSKSKNPDDQATPSKVLHSN